MLNNYAIFSQIDNLLNLIVSQRIKKVMEFRFLNILYERRSRVRSSWDCKCRSYIYLYSQERKRIVRFSRVIRLLANSARSRYLPSALSHNPPPVPTLSTLEDPSSLLPDLWTQPRFLPVLEIFRLHFVTHKSLIN